MGVRRDAADPSSELLAEVAARLRELEAGGVSDAAPPGPVRRWWSRVLDWLDRWLIGVECRDDDCGCEVCAAEARGWYW